MTLACDETQFYFDLIEPADVFRGVVHGEPAPQGVPGLTPEVIRQRLLAMRVEIVDHPVNRPRSGIHGDNGADHPRERGGGAIRRDASEMPSRRRFGDAEHIGGLCLVRTATVVASATAVIVRASRGRALIIWLVPRVVRAHPAAARVAADRRPCEPRVPSQERLQRR